MLESDHQLGSGPLRTWVLLLAFVALAFVAVASSHAATADEFQKVQCGGDIPKAMIGQHSSNGPVVATEKKYRALGLKDLGGDEISDSLSSVNWLICGAEYILLIDRGGTVRDAIAFPAHSKTSPAFSGVCQLKGKDLPDIFVAVLDGAKGGDALPVQSAWKIDQKRARFVAVPSEGLLCPRSGISTADGGR
jgi:hypothetical protein